MKKHVKGEFLSERAGNDARYHFHLARHGKRMSSHAVLKIHGQRRSFGPMVLTLKACVSLCDPHLAIKHIA